MMSQRERSMLKPLEGSALHVSEAGMTGPWPWRARGKKTKLETRASHAAWGEGSLLYSVGKRHHPRSWSWGDMTYLSLHPETCYTALWWTRDRRGSRQSSMAWFWARLGVKQWFGQKWDLLGLRLSVCVGGGGEDGGKEISKITLVWLKQQGAWRCHYVFILWDWEENVFKGIFERLPC